MPHTVSPGATVHFETFFRDRQGNAAIPVNPAVFEIRAPDQSLIVAGVGIQDVVDTSRWYASVSLPDALPEFPYDEKFIIGWYLKAKNITGIVYDAMNAEYFSVQNIEDIQFIQTDRVLPIGNDLTDLIVVPPTVVPESVTAQLITPSGGSLGTIMGIEEKAPTSNSRVFGFTTNAFSTLTLSEDPYIISWSYQPAPGQGIQNEFHFIYYVHPRAIYFANNLRTFIDKARNEDINVNLQMTELDLIKYLKMGMDRINVSPPQLTNFTVVGIPRNFENFVTYASAYEALSAQYLAEGMSSFDFGGQSTTLTIDRTQYIDGALGRIQSYLDEGLQKAKALLMRSRGSALLNITVGATVKDQRLITNPSQIIRGLIVSQGGSSAVRI